METTLIILKPDAVQRGLQVQTRALRRVELNQGSL
jgi:nucleoside diphosphate kinase